ncbi:MAG TPA: polysaccharide pyruvyl transferase family protein [Anaerolineae bacterium]|nr:polysaccharide pyruvyl transferase family protein [Anaerolineae bacterium]
MITLFCVRPKGFNIGNDAIFLAMQYFLQQAFGQLVNIVTFPATSRYESHAKAGLTPKTIFEINQYGHGVIVGGGNLYENGELEVNLEALQSLEVPLLLFSLSRGKIYNRQHRLVDRTDAMPARVVKALHAKARYSLARDEATFTYLQQLDCNNVQVCGCPTIFLDRLTNRLPNLSSRDQAGILISIRNPELMSIPLQKRAQIYNHIQQIIQQLRAENRDNIRLLCHDHRDIPFAASFPNIDYVYTGDIYSYLALLKSCKLNITYRLHSFLPCVAFNVPSINISYDERSTSLIKTVNLADWNINMICTDDVVEQVMHRVHHLSTLTRLREQAQPQWRQLNNVISQTFQNFVQDVLAYQAG